MRDEDLTEFLAMSEDLTRMLDETLGSRVELVEQTSHDRFIAELASDYAAAAAAQERLKNGLLLARDLNVLQNLFLRAGLRQPEPNMKMARALFTAIEALVEETKEYQTKGKI